jgi:SAM-dependent methyltransferase
MSTSLDRASVARKVVHAGWDVNQRLWRNLPQPLRDSRPIRAYGRWMHDIVCRRSAREMYLGTMFLRNRPALELMRRLACAKAQNSTFRIAVLGCSIGVEVYSILWVIRSARSDLDLVVQAVDISQAALDVGERGAYGPEAADMVHWSIFERMTDSERLDMFDWDGDVGRVKPWLRTGVSWRLADACDPSLGAELGPHDLVVASNFLCHLDAASAETCLRNLVRLVAPGGHLVVLGVDLDVRSKVALDLGWEPVDELREEIHDGDPAVRADWPWHWWGLEPLDRRRPDWQLRYASVFRIGYAG